MNTLYNPFAACVAAAIAELTSSSAQDFYISAALNTIDDTLTEVAIAAQFIQQVVGIAIWLCGEAYENGQVFRAQVHEGYHSIDATLALLPTETIDGELLPCEINTLAEQPLLLAPSLSTTAQVISSSEAWKTYVEACLGLKAWSEVIQANLTCKQILAELDHQGIAPAPKTRKPELVKLLAEGVK